MRAECSSIPAQTSVSWRRLVLMSLTVGVLAGLTVAAARAAARATSGTFDETIYLDLARRAWFEHNTEGFTELGVAPLPVMLAWSRAAVEPFDQASGDPAVYTNRVARARNNAIWWFAVPLVVSVFLWLAVRSGFAAGLMAAGVLALSPNLLGHAALATTDVAFALTVVLSLAPLTTLIESQSVPRAVALAAALGIALATKYSATALFVCAAAVMWLHRRGRRRSLDVLTLGGGLLVAWAAHGFALSPLISSSGSVAQIVTWAGVDSGRALEWLTALRGPSYVRGIAAQLYLERSGQEAFLLGARSPTGWWYYFPVALALKSTPVEMVALAAFVPLAAGRWKRDLDIRVLATAALVFGILPLAGHRNLGVRYLFPLVIIAVMGTAGWLGPSMSVRPRLKVATVALALAVQAGSFLSVAPQHLAYFNLMAGGPSRGYLRLVDSNLDWGQDLPRLSAWLREHQTNHVSLAYFGTAPPRAYDIDAVGYREAPGAWDRPKWFALSVTYLQGVFVCGDPFQAFRSLSPDARIGYSIMVYSTERADVQQALNAARLNACVH